MNINVDGVTITLTQDQLAEIAKQQENNKPILERVKSYEDACDVLGVKINSKAKADEKLKIFAKALNEGVKIDFTNHNQEKWYPYFTADSNGGLGFRGSGCRYGGFHGVVVYTTSKEKANHLGKYALGLYQELLNINY